MGTTVFHDGKTYHYKMGDEDPKGEVNMKPNWYKLASEAVEAGARYGVRRAFKYEEHPSAETVLGHVIDAVMSELCEAIDFENVGND